MPARDSVAKEKPLGPYSPPTPSEVDQKGAEPMAVANDKQQTHGESFAATTSSQDAYSPEIAALYKQVPDIKAKSNKESRAAERPEGYDEPNANGWAEPTLNGDEEQAER